MQRRLSAQEEAVQVEALVGRVRKGIRQDEADQQTGGLEQPAHDVDGADRSAATDQCRFLAIDLTQGLPPGLDQGMVDGRDPWIAVAAELGEADPHGLWVKLLDVAAQRLGDGLWILIGDEAAAELGGGPRRNDRLRAGALIAAPDPVDVEGRPRPVALGRCEARLAVQRPKAIGPLDLLLVKGHACELAAL